MAKITKELIDKLAKKIPSLKGGKSSLDDIISYGKDFIELKKNPNWGIQGHPQYLPVGKQTTPAGQVELSPAEALGVKLSKWKAGKTPEIGVGSTLTKVNPDKYISFLEKIANTDGPIEISTSKLGNKKVNFNGESFDVGSNIIQHMIQNPQNYGMFLESESNFKGAPVEYQAGMELDFPQTNGDEMGLATPEGKGVTKKFIDNQTEYAAQFGEFLKNKEYKDKTLPAQPEGTQAGSDDIIQPFDSSQFIKKNTQGLEYVEIDGKKYSPTTPKAKEFLKQQEQQYNQQQETGQPSGQQGDLKEVTSYADISKFVKFSKSGAVYVDVNGVGKPLNSNSAINFLKEKGIDPSSIDMNDFIEIDKATGLEVINIGGKKMPPGGKNFELKSLSTSIDNMKNLLTKTGGTGFGDTTTGMGGTPSTSSTPSSGDTTTTPSDTSTPVGQTPDEKMQAALDYIDSLDISEDLKSLYRQTIQNWDFDKEINIQNVLDKFNEIKEGTIDPEFKTIVQQATDALSSSVNSQLGERERALEQERFLAGESIRQAKANAEKSGMTFTGKSIEELGAQSAYAQPGTEAAQTSATPLQTPFGGLFYEGNVNQQNRLLASSSAARTQRNLQLLGQGAEAQLGTAGALGLNIPGYGATGGVTGTIEDAKQQKLASTLTGLSNQNQQNVAAAQPLNINL